MNAKDEKRWWFIAWEEVYHNPPHRQLGNCVTDIHPVAWLIAAREGNVCHVNLLFFEELKVTDSQAVAWRKRLEEQG